LPEQSGGKKAGMEDINEMKANALSKFTNEVHSCPNKKSGRNKLFT